MGSWGRGGVHTCPGMRQVHSRGDPVPGTVVEEGGLTLTCQKTKRHTHNDDEAEHPEVSEYLVADPRNDRVEVVTFGHQAAEDIGDKKDCLLQ